MTVSVDDIKNSLRLDDTDDAEVAMLQNYITAAGDYVRHAVDSTIDPKDYEQYSQYDIAVAMLVEFWYQNRGQIATASQEIPYTVISMIQQLRGSIISAAS